MNNFINIFRCLVVEVLITQNLYLRYSCYSKAQLFWIPDFRLQTQR